MKLETFFEKFELFADAPDAVERMRELVLQLAAHGKLAKQSKDDEPAAELLKRIESNFRDLRKHKLRSAPPIEGLERSELPEIPQNWEWVPLGNVVAYGSPEKVDSTEIPNDAWLLDLEDIEKDTSKLLQRKLFRDSPSQSTKARFAAGDVLYGKLRPYLNKVMVADAPGYCTTEIIPIRTFGFIEPRYLCLALKRPEFIAYANSKSYGMNLPRLGTEDAHRAPFPLPPLAEQKRIVAKVDELMLLCDRLEAQQQERKTRHTALVRASLSRFAEAPTPANLEFLFHKSYAIPPAELRKSILTLAVQGRLSNVAPAIVEEQTAELNGLTHPKYPMSYGVLKPGPHDPHGVRLVKSQHIRNWKVSDTIEYKITPALDAEFKRTKLKGGEVLLNLVGASIGRCAIAPPSLAGANVSRAVAVITLAPEYDAKFVLILLTAAFTPERIALLSSGTAQPVLNLGVIRKMRVWLPPRAEQLRIVAKVDQLMTSVDRLEMQLTASRSIAEKTTAAIVAELTSQD